jgi:lipopolysaccharide export system permease protein
MPRGREAGSRPYTLWAYVLREFALSFSVAFLFFFVVFFVNQLLLMAEDILSRRAPLGDVLLLLLYAVPSEIAMAFPFASLVGALMSAGRLSSDNELLVMQAAGIPARRVFVPFAVLGLVFSLVSFTANEFFLPLASIQYGKLYRSLIVSSPAVELRPWSTRHYRGVTIVTGEVRGSVVEDVLIFDRAEGDKERVISARSAELRSGSGSDVILHLSGVWIQGLSTKDEDRVEYSSADEMDYRVDTEAGGSASAIVGPYEMSSYDLGRVIAEKERVFGARLAEQDAQAAVLREGLESAYTSAVAEGLAFPNARSRIAPALAKAREAAARPTTDRSIQVYKLEYYKKFAIPAGAFCFVLMAFPLGVRARKSGRSVGFGLGLLVSVAYWALLLGGSTVGTRLGWSPFWSMWGPNAFVLACGAGLWASGRLAA